MSILLIGWLAFTASGLLLLHRPRPQPYWPRVTQAYITAIFSEDPEAKAAAWADFDKQIGVSPSPLD